MPSPAAESASFYPSLLFDDAAAAIEWARAVLGCELRELVHDDAGRVVHAELALGGGLVMISSAGAGQPPFSALRAGDSIVYCAVDDPDALHDRAVAAGAEVARPLSDTDYGSRDFTLRDPEGNLWAFGTYRPTG